MRCPYRHRSARTTPEAPGTHKTPLWSFRPQSDREAGDAIVSNFSLHWFPAKVSKAAMSWSYSFWLGTISAALFLLLILSGLPLLFLYVRRSSAPINRSRTSNSSSRSVPGFVPCTGSPRT